MADVQMPIMPESIPCRFNDPYVGKCNKPSTNGWCSKHEPLVCVSCGAKATRSCSQAISLVCGCALCNDCCHEPYGEKHITKQAAHELLEQREREREATKASRTSPVQRMNEELGVPVNLFELLKDVPAGYTLRNFYYLEVDHGLMAFIPAGIKETHNVMATTDLALALQVWAMLPPKKSKLGTNTGYANDERALMYPMLGSTSEDHERSKPIRLLTNDWFRELREKDPEPFEWGGFVLGCNTDRAEVLRRIDATAREHGIVFKPISPTT